MGVGVVVVLVLVVGVGVGVVGVGVGVGVVVVLVVVVVVVVPPAWVFSLRCVPSARVRASPNRRPQSVVLPRDTRYEVVTIDVQPSAVDGGLIVFVTGTIAVRRRAD